MRPYETTDEEIGVYYPVFYDAFAWSAQSAETLQHALQHTDQKRWFTVYEHDQSAGLFFIIYGWRQKDIFL